MADKRISQLIERVDIANNDVLPIVASGATTTNKVTISTLQDWMQDNLDVGVTSVGITLGTSGTDVNVTGSPITTSGNITINIPTASATNRGLLSAADWTTFNNKADAGNYVTLDTAQTITAQKTFTTSGGDDTLIVDHTSGSGIALDISKAGNGEGLRVTKTSGSGNAVTITGGNFSAEAATFSGVVTTTPDAVINGVNVGKGGGSLTTNTRLGSACLSSNTTGTVNTSVGYGSLQFNTIGSSNTSVGVNSLQTNTEGDANTSVGSNSLTANTTGDNNTSVGAVALYSNTSGTQNTATGAVALYFNTVGNSNTAVGLQSAYKNTTGNNNVAVGLNSLFGNTTGTSNVALGHGAGNYITNDAAENSISNNSVFLGSQTKAQANNQTNQIVIGHLTTGNGSNTVTIGNSSITDNYFSGEVHSTSFEIAAAGTANPTILRNTNGTSSSTTGSNVIGFNGTNNIFVTTQSRGGFILGFNNSVSNREYTLPDASGTIALTSNLSAYLPLTGGTLTGALNGTSASFSGRVTMNGGSTITTNQDVIFGNTSGEYIGQYYNGTDLHFYNGTGGSNLFSIKRSTGAATFSSSAAGYGITLNHTSENLRLKMGAIAGGVINIQGEVISSGGVYPIVLNRDGGSVGIGTDSPTAKLDVLGASGNITSDMGNGTIINIDGGSITSTNFGVGIGFVRTGSQMAYIKAARENASDEAAYLAFATQTGAGAHPERMRITSVGNTQPGADNAYSLGVSGTRWSAVWAANGTIQTSDEREKKDIVDSDLGLDLITKLRPVSFKWKVGQNVVTSQVVKDEEGNPILDEEGNEKTESVLIPREGKRTHYGLIAQEVEEVLDGKDFGGFIHDEETDTKGLRYDQFVPLLIKSIQELNEKIAILESKLK